MYDTDLAFLDSLFPNEYNRILFLYKRDGIIDTYSWVNRTYGIYKQHLRYSRKNKCLPAKYKREFILACIDFRLFLKLYRKTVDLPPNTM